MQVAPFMQLENAVCMQVAQQGHTKGKACREAHRVNETYLNLQRLLHEQIPDVQELLGGGAAHGGERHGGRGCPLAGGWVPR